jgi:hypothetical protein
MPCRIMNMQGVRGNATFAVDNSDSVNMKSLNWICILFVLQEFYHTLMKRIYYGLSDHSSLISLKVKTNFLD